MRKERTGSTKIITAVKPGEVDFTFTDQWSAFDRGSSPQLIPGIGAARCACAVKSFELVQAVGLPTHFIRQVDTHTIRVHEYSLPSQESLSGRVYGRVLNAEWIWRTHVLGSLLERIVGRKIDPISLGFASGIVITEGMKLPRLFIECTTKFEPVDRHLTNIEARELNEVSRVEWEEARNLIQRAIRASNAQYERASFKSVDGKLELAMRTDGRLVIVDVFGTPDENRILHKQTGDLFSKDLIRNWLKKTPWKALLDEAKKEHPKDKSKWPPYPELPEDLVKFVSRRYKEIARRYASVRM